MRFEDIKESALMALDTLLANKLRSALTILGVSVGVVTVIFMVSIIQGLNKAFADQIESLGSNTIFVSKFEPSFGKPPGPDEIHRKDLTMDDAEALRTEAPSIVGVSPIHRLIASTVRYQDKQTDTPCSASRLITSLFRRSTWRLAGSLTTSTCRIVQTW
jgi:putative ABC transport system permease protein